MPTRLPGAPFVTLSARLPSRHRQDGAISRQGHANAAGKRRFGGLTSCSRFPPAPLTGPAVSPAEGLGCAASSPFTFRGVSHMSDLLFVGLTVVVFAVIGLVAKGVDRL